MDENKTISVGELIQSEIDSGNITQEEMDKAREWVEEYIAENDSIPEQFFLVPDGISTPEEFIKWLRE